MNARVVLSVFVATCAVCVCCSTSAFAADTKIGAAHISSQALTKSSASAERTIMYRLYNPNSGEHFYTASEHERAVLIVLGWADEGLGWIAPKTSRTPVYRLYNANAGDHHYTVSAKERDHLKRVGWKDEGIGWYSDDSKRIPLYRQYNPHAYEGGKSGAHNYTVDKNERDHLVSIGWRGENVGWYGLGDNRLSLNLDHAYGAIEANAKLKGTGEGYHAKVVISGVPHSGVASFNINHEQGTNEAMGGGFPDDTRFFLENVMSHVTEPGNRGKEYLPLKSARLNTTYRIRLSYYQHDAATKRATGYAGEFRVYVNDVEIGGSMTTTRPPFIFAVEGGAKHHGNSVDAVFSNVRIKVGDSPASYGTIGMWDAGEMYFGFKSKVTHPGSPGKANTPFAGFGQGAAMRVTGKANIPGVSPLTNERWNWDDCFLAHDYVTDPHGSGVSAHAMSAKVRIAQKR